MKRLVANIAIAVVLALGVIAPTATARQPPLINPGPEQPVGDNETPMFGVANAPAQPGLAKPKRHFTDQSALSFTFHSPVEAFIVDPLGRREGRDPRTDAAYNEIPKSSYSSQSTIGPVIPMNYEPPKVLHIHQPLEGLYTLTVVGTGVGTYDADFEAYDIALNSTEVRLKDMPTAAGAVDTYQIDFSSAVGSQVRMAGSFNGEEQTFRDFPRFLTYSASGESRVTLAAGATHYPLQLFYGTTIVPSSFRARFNDVDVTALFHPVAGTGETVLLAVRRGRNSLRLWVDGEIANRKATYLDWLYFDVP